MNISSPTRGIAVLLVLIGTLLLLAGTAQASSGAAGMSKAEYRARMLRSEALNERYGLGYGTSKPAGMTSPEFRALMIRSKALDAKYGLVGGSRVAVSPQPAVTVVRSGFEWRDFGIGAATVLGLGLIAIGLAAGNRRIPRPRISS